MRVITPVDGGNLQVEPDGTATIAPDPSGVAHWFCFAIAGAAGETVELTLRGAGASPWASGWEGFRAVSSDDDELWPRIATTYADGALTITVRPESDRVVIAPFAPYPLARHQALIERYAALADHEVLGHSVDGLPIDALSFGTGPRQVVVIARQHPGEPMAEWWAEGLLSALRTRPLHGIRCTVVPNMNPDGTRRGYHRCNANGVDLNRAWQDPTGAPEVAAVRDRLWSEGADLFLDVHGDEVTRWVFTAGPENVPDVDPAVVAAHETFRRAYRRADSAFQWEHGYPVGPPGSANLAIAKSAVAARLGCLAMTLEQPFGDCADAPDSVYGWHPGRVRLLGHAGRDAIAATLGA